VNGSKSPAAAVQSAANTINGIVAGGANGGP